MAALFTLLLGKSNWLQKSQNSLFLSKEEGSLPTNFSEYTVSPSFFLENNYCEIEGAVVDIWTDKGRPSSSSSINLEFIKPVIEVPKLNIEY